MRKLIVFAVLVAICGSAAYAQDDLNGFTMNQLQRTLGSSSLIHQKLWAIQTFGSGDIERPAYLTVLSSSRSGWHISVFHRVKGGFRPEWLSRSLSAEFDRSSPDNFSVEKIDDDFTVRFSGCAAHRCGGDVHGFLLYSTVKKQAFFALLERQEDMSNKVTFSANVLDPNNRKYKEVLQASIDDLVRRTSFLK